MYIVPRRVRRAIAGIAAAIYGAALGLPTAAPFNPEFSSTVYPGSAAFGAGRSLLAWEPQNLDWWILGGCWLANPAIGIAIVCVAAGRWKAGAIASSCGLLLGLAALPRFYPIIAHLPGYWAWIGSAAVLLAACTLVISRNQPSAFADAPPA